MQWNFVFTGTPGSLVEARIHGRSTTGYDVEPQPTFRGQTPEDLVNQIEGFASANRTKLAIRVVVDPAPKTSGAFALAVVAILIWLTESSARGKRRSSWL